MKKISQLLMTLGCICILVSCALFGYSQYRQNKEIKDIQKGQILVFRYKKKIISHRVYSIIKREDGTYYKTKGDNNAQVDDNIVKKNDVIGIAVLRIKYLGIPSVKLQELFR